MEIKFLEKGNNLCLHSEGSGREGLSSLPDFFPIFVRQRHSDTAADYGHPPEIKKLLILLKILTLKKELTIQFTRESFALMAMMATAVPATGTRYCSKYWYQSSGISSGLNTSMVVCSVVDTSVVKLGLEVGRLWPGIDLPILREGNWFEKE